MFSLTVSLGLLAVLHVASCSTQQPPVTQCPGSNDLLVRIINVTVEGAKLGSEIKLDATLYVRETVGKNPVLQQSFSRPDGTELPCVEEISPCNLNLCNGKTRTEKRLNKDWNNSCPVQAGTYTSELLFRLPKDKETKEYFGDGNVVVNVKIVDNGQLLACATYPLKVDVD